MSNNISNRSTGDCFKRLPVRRSSIQLSLSNPSTSPHNIVIGGGPPASFNFNGGVRRIPDFDRTYTITITNANAAPASIPVTLFGAKQFLFSTPVVPGITITVPESSYDEIVQESLLSPFIVGGATIQSTNANQLQDIPVISHRSTNGVICTSPFHISSYISVNQFQSAIVDIFPINITVDGETSIVVNVLALSTIQITLYVKERIRKDNKLHDEPIIEMSENIAAMFKTEFVG